ncbi:deazaflavin-dependent oxidoreductase (nitroreductase family) [Georgenia soli]|uniref:Deazaflavin-dependent oxidoreductase (Nitroreductase family) n=1 Tax=Georgenia soli TaxID=638953 RepID=A0A2A9EKR6_9MICO|nr:nitroreductase/quinone reductase family protein [Georgenia soli]PFG38809.1 deazaflavin-dependent oxidoreductase (nitroreductase family) [Georgenia soli]
MGHRVRRGLLITTAAGAAALVAFFVLLRSGGPRTKHAVARFNKRVLNPAMLRLAGRRHWYTSVLRHTGRRSGRAFATPVVAVPVDGGFVVPLPYGQKVDWLRNVRAAGRAVLTCRGTTYDVSGPEVLDAAVVMPMLEPRYQRVWRRYDIEHFLRVRAVPRTSRL